MVLSKACRPVRRWFDRGTDFLRSVGDEQFRNGLVTSRGHLRSYSLVSLSLPCVPLLAAQPPCVFAKTC